MSWRTCALLWGCETTWHSFASSTRPSERGPCKGPATEVVCTEASAPTRVPQVLQLKLLAMMWPHVTWPAPGLPHAAHCILRGPALLLACPRRRGVGDTSVKKLQAHAAQRGLSLCALLFGRPAAGALLPPLPERKELGLTPQAAAALQAFRELVLALHDAVGSRPLATVIRDIIEQVGVNGSAAALLGAMCYAAALRACGPGRRLQAFACLPC